VSQVRRLTDVHTWSARPPIATVVADVPALPQRARSCPLGYGLLLMKPQERLAMVPYLIGKAEKKQRPKRNRRPPTVGSAVTST
jgi:hypothetical protein